MTTNGKGGITPLTPKYKEINSVLARIHHNRISRKGLKQNQTQFSNNQERLIRLTPGFS